MGTSASSTVDGEMGFTLLELLVALTLLGLLMVLAFGGLRFGTRVWERSYVYGTGTDQVRLVQSLIRREIEFAYPLYASSGGSDPRVIFEGMPDALRFVAPAPLSLDDGNNAVVSFNAQEHEGDKSLVLTVVALSKIPDRSSPRRSEVLLGDLESVQFSYFGVSASGENATWHDQWENSTRLPELIRISLKFKEAGSRVWPEMIVAPSISVDVACIYDRLTKYCQGR